jgi:hypothetical protein
MAFWNRKKKEQPQYEDVTLRDPKGKFARIVPPVSEGPSATTVGSGSVEFPTVSERQQIKDQQRQEKLLRQAERQSQRQNVDSRPIRVDKLSNWEKQQLRQQPKQLPQAAPKSVYDDLESERAARLAAEDNARQEKASREASSKKYQEDLKKGLPPKPSKESILSRLNPRDRKAYEKEYARAEAEKAKAEFENWKYGIPTTGPTRYTREWVNSFTVQKGQTYEDPQSKRVYTEGQTVPGHHLIIPIPGEPLSGVEQSQIRQTAELNQMQMQALRGQAAQAQRERRFGWVRDVGTSTMGAVAMGVGSAGRAIGYGRGSVHPMERARRSVVPQPGGQYNPIYQINRPSVPIIRQPTPQFNPGMSSLSALRNIQIVRNQNLNPVGGRTNLMQNRAPSTPQGVRGTLPNITAKHDIIARKMRLW